MATTKQISKQSVNQIWQEVYIKRKLPNGDYEPDWFEVTRDLTRGLNRIRYAIDQQDYDIGIFRQNNVSISLNNRFGRYSDIDDSRSYWAAMETRHLTKFKIDYGYLDENGEKINNTVFNGLLDDRSVKYDDNDNVGVTLLAREYIFKNLRVVGGTFSSPILASKAIEIMLTRGEILQQFNVDILQIQPDLDILIDNPSDYNTKKLDQALNDILFHTNSVGFIDSNGTFIVRSRHVHNTINHKFYSNPSVTIAKDNLMKISGKNSGRHRIKNSLRWGNQSAQSAQFLLDRYGTTGKSIGTDSITDIGIKQVILNSFLTEWQYPKDEFEITTDYIGDTTEILQLVTLDAQPEYSNPDVPFSNEAIAGIDLSVGFCSGMLIGPERGFKIIGIEHDLSRATTTLKLREKGVTLMDGYFDMLATAKYEISFIAESFKEVNTVPKGINAQCARVEVLDPDDDFSTVDIVVKRPNVSTLRIEAGANITKDFVLLVTEVLA